MKEAIGGTWIYGIVIVFILLFTSFVSLATNYSRCFKIKDEIVSSIEIYNGVNYNSIKNAVSYLKGIGYASENECPKDGSTWYGFGLTSINESSETVNAISANNVYPNFCISKVPVNDVDIVVGRYGKEAISRTQAVGHAEASYYKVVVFFQLNVPVIRELVNLKIAGETSVLYLANDRAIEQYNADGSRRELPTHR